MLSCFQTSTNARVTRVLMEPRVTTYRTVTRAIVPVVGKEQTVTWVSVVFVSISNYR